MRIDTGTPYRVQPDLKAFFQNGLALIHRADDAITEEHIARIQQMEADPRFHLFGIKKKN